MFIELTDHLRCPEDHPESFLVLLTSVMDGRRVRIGELGCPVCGRVVKIKEGVALFGATPEPAAPASVSADAPHAGAPLAAAAAPGTTALTAPAIAAFLGLSGPGGYAVVVGPAGGQAGALVEALPGIRLALVNPPAGTPDTDAASVVRSARLPIKANAVRGVVLSGPAASDSAWIADAVRAVLPGLRVVVEGGEPPEDLVEVLGASAECWVGRKRG